MLNLQESQYFNTLPNLIKESILQSNVSFSDEEELHGFVNNLEM